MARARVTDPETHKIIGWFDDEKAEIFTSARVWNGQNRVNAASGVEGVEQYLYRTAQGRWVIARDETRTQINGRVGGTTYRYADDDEAREWMIRAEVDDAEIERFFAMPEEVQIGRPDVGPQVVVRMPVELRDKVDEVAAAAGVTRAAWIRTLVEGALS